VKSYVRNIINLSCAKILLTSVISSYTQERGDLLGTTAAARLTRRCWNVLSQWLFDLESACVMQPNVANKVQMIHHQLTVLTTASRLEVQPCAPGRSAIAASMIVYRILRTLPVACVN